MVYPSTDLHPQGEVREGVSYILPVRIDQIRGEKQAGTRGTYPCWSAIAALSGTRESWGGVRATWRGRVQQQPSRMWLSLAWTRCRDEGGSRRDAEPGEASDGEGAAAERGVKCSNGAAVALRARSLEALQSSHGDEAAVPAMDCREKEEGGATEREGGSTAGGWGWQRGSRRVGGWVRVFVTREKLHRWMGAPRMAQIESNLVIHVKAVPRISLVHPIHSDFPKHNKGIVCQNDLVFLHKCAY